MSGSFAPDILCASLAHLASWKEWPEPGLNKLTASRPLGGIMGPCPRLIAVGTKWRSQAVGTAGCLAEDKRNCAFIKVANTANVCLEGPRGSAPEGLIPTNRQAGFVTIGEKAGILRRGSVAPLLQAVADTASRPRPKSTKSTGRPSLSPRPPRPLPAPSSTESSPSPRPSPAPPRRAARVTGCCRRAAAAGSPPSAARAPHPPASPPRPAPRRRLGGSHVAAVEVADQTA